uniref:Uncharacterized protein n=1 Tax=Anguilla anguilla TaxID=7936 RepID=A0A0E9RDD0_ANGAN
MAVAHQLGTTFQVLTFCFLFHFFASDSVNQASWPSTVSN